MSNRVLIDQTTNTVNTDQCPEIHNSVVVNNEIPSNIDVIENVTNIITVTVPGPQGPQGPNGAEANISGSSNYIPIFSGSDALVTSSIYQSGSFTAIGATSSLHPNAPETLLVNSLTDSYNLISGHANIDDYVQLNIKNFSGGPSASSDIVATADIGDEESNYINMGINGSNYTAGNAIGGALDAYLYNTGENLYIGNTAQSKQIVFFNGGFDVNANAALFIHDQGTITINTAEYNETHPPSLGIQAPNSTTNTLIEAVGNTDQFLQLALSNQNSGSFASSDIVAYNNIDPTNQAFGFIDMGINSTNFDDPTNYPGWIGGHSYLFSDAPGMIIGSTSGSSQVNIFAGGVNPITNSKLVIRANNIHSLTGSLEVTGSITSSLFGTASWALNAITASYVPASGVVGLNLSQISTGSVTASVNIGSTMFSVISGSASSSLVLTNNGFLTNESSGAPYFRLSNNNNNVNLSPGQAAAYIEVIGRRAGSNGALARLTTTYIGDGTTRNSRFSIGTAEGTGFGGSQISIYKLSSGPSINQQITVIGTGVDAYSTSSVIASASYTSRANVIINGASVNNIVSFDSNGTSQALVFNTGNWGINTTVDNGFKFDISGSARVQAGLIVTGSLVAPDITGSLLGTASWAQNALTASFGGNFTASNALITNTLTAQTLVVQTITSSTDFVTGSTRFGSLLSNTHQFTGSVSITGSLDVNGRVVPSGNAAVNQITYWTGANTQTGSADLTWDGANVVLGNDKGIVLQTNGTNRNISIKAAVVVDNFANAIFYPSSGTNVASTFTVSPRGTGYSALIKSQISIFNTDLVADNVNYEFAAIRAGGTSYTLATGKSGTGTNRPILLSSGFLDGVTNPNQLWLYTTGNVGINTTSDTGERLQVSGSSKFVGDMVITGSGNTNATNALNIRNSSGTSLLSVRNDGITTVGGQLNVSSLIYGSAGTITIEPGNSFASIRLKTFEGGSTIIANVDNFQPTTINVTSLILNQFFSPTSGIATYISTRINPTINQTGGANGISRGLYVNPTLTAAADWRSIEWTNNAATAPSASWGLYGSGSAPNYINGSVSIGTLTTGSALTVSGSSVMSGSLNVTQGITSSLFGTASWAQNAVTASYVANASSFPFTGSAIISGSLTVTGSFNVTQGITSSLFGTASWAQNALTASFVSTASLASNFFVQGGNSFGTTALLGTNDTQSLAFETSGSVRMFISSSGNVGIGTSTPTVALQVASDAIISDIRVGTGPGTGNVYIGQSVGGISTTNAQSMDDNVFIGRSAGSTFSGNSNGNVAIGVSSLRGGSNVEYNTAVGFLSLQNYTGQYTTALGYNAGGNLTSGGFNTIIGYNTGLGITTGASNTIIGAQITGLASNLANTIAISDGAGTIRIYSPSTGNVLIQNGGTFSDSGERLQVSGSTRLSGNTVITGSLIVTQGITGSLFGTSSWANNAVSASQATTASSADNFTVRGTLTAQTIVVQTITSSTDFVSGSTIFGNSLGNTHQFTGSVSITGSLTLPYLSTGSVLFAGATDNIAEDNTNFFWDNTNKRLGVGTNTPTQTLDVFGGNIRVGKTTSNDDKIFIGTNTTDAINERLLITPFLIRLNSNTQTLTISGDNIDNGGLITLNSRNIDSGSLVLGTRSISGFKIFGTTRNVAIQNGGTFTDTGERLQVSGSSRFVGNMVITGSGADSTTNGLTIQNSNNTDMFRFRNDGSIRIGTQTILLSSTGNGSTTSLSGRGVLLQTGIGTAAGVGEFTIVGSINPASLSSWTIRSNTSFIPDSGTATYSGVWLQPVINQTGGANGISRGLYVNPTLTAAADFRAIEWSNNIATSPSASWGLYGAGTAPNFLSGSLSIGTTSSLYKLEVAGDARIQNSLLIGSTVTGFTFSSNTITTYTNSFLGIPSDRFFSITDTSFTSVYFRVIRNTGAILIGTTTDDGVNRLQVSGSSIISGSLTVTQGITGSLFGTASWAQNAVTASYALTAQTLLGSVVSASYAATASYATSFYVSGTLNVGNTNIEFQENTNVTSGTWRVVSSEPTASYKAAFFDYVMFSGSIARAGTVYSVWSASYAEYYENYTGDVGGSTAGVSLQAAISGSNIQLQATASNNGWTIRSLVRML